MGKLPEGRKPLTWADMTPKHSSWEAEAKALRARVEAGEFRSMRAAALEAGIVKPPCPVKAAKRAVEKMDEDQLAEFSDWLETRSSAERDY